MCCNSVLSVFTEINTTCSYCSAINSTLLPIHCLDIITFLSPCRALDLVPVFYQCGILMTTKK